ncbi:MAG: WecB/TagA/CpsF family glycosyltransferase [Microcoleaceae cyanobacterium]
MNIVKVLNVSIDNLSLEELLSQLAARGGVVFTPNVDHLMTLQRDEEFYDIYQHSDYRVCDSKILYYASRFLGQPIREKISGSDLFPAFYRHFKHCQETKIFLLGAAEGVAHRAQQRINQLVGREMIIDCYSPPFGFEKDEVECQKIIDRINASGATVLAVGLGAPKQEKWIIKYKDQLEGIKIYLAIGATIDFEAGEKPRSPKWVSEMGLEWLYRLSSEPKRLWRRYLVDDLPFVWLVLQQKFNWYMAPVFSRPVFGLSLWQMPRIGQLLQEAGLVSDSQVKLVLEAQSQQSHLRFGEILASWGWLSQETVDFFAEKLPKLAREKHRYPIGHYLRAANLLTAEQVELLVREQSTSSLRFGELAAHKGWIQQETVDTIMRYLPARNSHVGVMAEAY